jgi:hypothetical protein
MTELPTGRPIPAATTAAKVDLDQHVQVRRGLSCAISARFVATGEDAALAKVLGAARSTQKRRPERDDDQLQKALYLLRNFSPAERADTKKDFV